MPEDWPQNRAFPFFDCVNISALHGAWQFSAARIANLKRHLADYSLPKEIACVAVSGSLARMEAHAGSDIDLMVVVDDRKTTVSNQRALQIFADVWDSLAGDESIQPLKAPKPGGVFSQCALWSTLVNPAAKGIVNEDMTSYGQRMQLLLDAQPIFQHSCFETLQADLLSWYAENRIQQLFHEAGPFHWLWQEVHRYWRSIRARACWLHAEEACKSLEVNVKLRSSRLLLITGFLLAIDAAHMAADSLDDAVLQLLNSLRQTPMERTVLALNSDERAERLLVAYQTAWDFIRRISVNDCMVPDEILAALHELRDLTRDVASNGGASWFL